MKVDQAGDDKNLRQDNQYYRNAGIILITAGLVFTLDQVIQSGWLSLLVMPFLGLVGLFAGIRHNRLLWAIPGALVAGLGLGGLVILNQTIELALFIRIGTFFVVNGLGFFGILLATILMRRTKTFWALIPGLILIGIGLPFLLGRITIFDFFFFGLTGLGLGFLVWGIHEKLKGLIIPGCLLLGIGPGIYLAWAKVETINGLTNTGVMLVWFALGWGLITIVMRVVTEHFVWWPLIPGGLLAVVGWGLYIGGDPGNALSFIGNTGSIGLFIFGIYLLLLRRGFKG